ncbi:MAG: endonuclease MutS2 [Bacteroidota bacterium]
MIEFQSAAEKLEFKKILGRLETYASSDLGKDAAEHIVPTENLSQLAQELNRVDEMKKLLESDDPFPIDGLRNIRESLQRAGIENSILSASDLFPIAQTLQAARNLKLFILKRKEAYRELHTFCEAIIVNKILEYNITQAIDLNGTIKDSASKELKEIRSELVSMYELLRKQLGRILKNVSEQGLTQEEIITTRDGRMVIPVKVEQKHSVPGFIHSSSASGSTVFIEPAETLSLNNEIRELLFREQREIEKILRTLTIQVREVHLDLLKSLVVLQRLDLIYAKAKYSIEIKGNKPFLKEIGSLKIVDARHPILLLRHSRQQIIPLSIELGSGYKTLLITGPNAGGKSVAMKTVGVLVLMLQCGIHIPASPDSEFPIFERLFVDIGDDQSIENDLSTFSSHITMLKGILNSADDHSLVLVDEIGAGTDPVEGGALAAVILAELTKVGALTIATTHQVTLKAFVHETEGMENGAMEFDQTTLMPTFNFRIGVPGSSYALEIARRLGVPSTLIAEAEKMAGEQKSRLEKLIVDLESRSQSLSKQIFVVDTERLKLNDLVKNYETKLKGLKEEVKLIKSKAIEEAKEIIDRANSIIEKSVKEIRLRQADKNSIIESKEEIKILEKEILSVENALMNIESDAPDHQRVDKMTKGSVVKLILNSQVGEILQPPDSNGLLQVAFDNLKLRVHINDVIPFKKSDATSHFYTAVPLDAKVEREIDVRGLYGDEALGAVDKFIDSAIFTGLHQVNIIHGKGSGALRKKISLFLKSDSRIKSHRFGEWNEGGMGVTIVDLKDE